MVDLTNDSIIFHPALRFKSKNKNSKDKKRYVQALYFGEFNLFFSTNFLDK